ncbi:hypothetical protein CWO85_01265 [Candidatus Phytoplasma ziziphi]|uniref:Uncharacterized protein n=1 Tax=Ziziphus jujuba witches'-broom phytoplasma TaxID=135727 RepID=A0A660HMF4_ZIZJU|nr:hypothetical protein [Candidatus Phytoplasma ziziphi]AYJ01162.1 hypothetical protein CWO85_01265 [Candidatus Phytoplasma ziziphi]
MPNIYSARTSTANAQENTAQAQAKTALAQKYTVMAQRYNTAYTTNVQSYTTNAKGYTAIAQENTANAQRALQQAKTNKEPLFTLTTQEITKTTGPNKETQKTLLYNIDYNLKDFVDYINKLDLTKDPNKEHLEKIRKFINDYAFTKYSVANLDNHIDINENLL